MTVDTAKNISDHVQTALKESHVVIIQQSIKKNREYRQRSLESDNFNYLQGFETHHLRCSMRMSVENQKLVDSAQNVIAKRRLETPIPSRKRKINNEKQPEVKTKKRFTGASTDKEIPTSSTSPSSALKLTSPLKEENAGSFQDYDIFLKLLSKSQAIKTVNNTVTTAITFTDGEIGHEINSKKPKLIYLPQTNDVDEVKVLSLVLDNNCLKTLKPVFITNSLQSAKLLTHSVKACNKDAVLYIPYLRRRNPKLREKENLISTLANSSVLITDYKSLLGMEHECVITVVDPAEKVLRHSLVETISRCSSYLYIFVQAHEVENKEGNIQEILDAWKSEGLVDIVDVKLQSGHKESKPIDTSPGIITVCTTSKKFVSLSQLIENFTNEEFQASLPDEESR